MACLRVAFLPDTFHEINGVAHTSQQLESFARRHSIPFLSIHCGPEEETVRDGAVTVMQVRRGPAKIGLDAQLDHDPLLFRYVRQMEAQMRDFGADLIHVTGPGDMGMIGFCLARRLGLPLVISWHTSLHEYAGRRLERLIGFLGPKLSGRIGAFVERLSFRILAWFYRRATIALAPNEEIRRVLAEWTGRPVFLMKRGVDTVLFTPARRNRVTKVFRIGYVGRLTAEKNVRFLATLRNGLKMLGREDFEMVIVGEGREQTWLRANVPNALFTGVLRGERLAEMYASMDLFAFPSRTDTFGNVVLEAFASGVPVVGTASGGPKFLIEQGVTGFVAATDRDFISAVHEIMMDPDLHERMRAAARRYALEQTWDAVFDDLFRAYESARPATQEVRPALARSGL
jgi:phosphatidylinositol alpha 1,6-mannosyltransferase